MKRIYLLLMFVSVLMLTVFSCKEEDEIQLQSPKLAIESVTANSFAVKWESVGDAVAYQYEFQGKSEIINELRVEFNELTPTETYKLKVKSVAENRSNDSEWSELNVTLDEDTVVQDEKLSFEFRTALDELMLTVEVIPSDKERTYRAEVITSDIYAEAENNPEVAFRTMLDDFTVYFGSVDEAFAQISMKGDLKEEFSLPAYNSDYYVILAGFDEKLQINTEVEVLKVTTGAAGHSDNTFNFEDKEITVSSIRIDIIPSNSDSYAYVLLDKSEIDNYSGSLEDFVNTKFDKDYFRQTYSGRKEVLYEKNIKPSSEYSLLVFGWELGLTTNVFRHDVRTEDPNPSKDVTFVMEANVLNSTEVEVNIKPSIPDAVYYYNLITKEEYDRYKDDLRQYIVDVCNKSGISLFMYLTEFCSVGEENYIYRDLKPGTEYVLFAAGTDILDDDFIFYTPYIYDGKIITESEAQESLTFPELMLDTMRGGKMYVYIYPSDIFQPYVYDIMIASTYGNNSSDLERYFSKKAEAKGMSLVEYIKSIQRTGSIEEYLEDTYSAGDYVLMACGVSIDGETVKFHKPQVTDYTVTVR